MTKKLVVSIYGGPNIGKTTVAAELFVELKKHHIDTGIVTEFAQDMILEGRPDVLKHQWYVISNQAYRILCDYNSMQVVLVDSPILLGPIYDQEASPALFALCMELYHKFNNLNVLLQRADEWKHSMAGRVHSLTESISIDNRIERMLEENDIPFIRYAEYTKERTVQLILRELHE